MGGAAASATAAGVEEVISFVRVRGEGMGGCDGVFWEWMGWIPVGISGGLFLHIARVGVSCECEFCC